MAAGNRLAAFYAARADAALVVTGGLAPCTEGWLAPFSSRLASTRDHHIGGLRLAIEEVGVQKIPVEPQAERAPDPCV